MAYFVAWCVACGLHSVKDKMNVDQFVAVGGAAHPHTGQPCRSGRARVYHNMLTVSSCCPSGRGCVRAEQGTFWGGCGDGSVGRFGECNNWDRTNGMGEVLRMLKK